MLPLPIADVSAAPKTAPTHGGKDASEKTTGGFSEVFGSIGNQGSAQREEEQSFSDTEIEFGLETADADVGLEVNPTLLDEDAAETVVFDPTEDNLPENDAASLFGVMAGQTETGRRPETISVLEQGKRVRWEKATPIRPLEELPIRKKPIQTAGSPKASEKDLIAARSLLEGRLYQPPVGDQKMVANKLPDDADTQSTMTIGLEKKIETQAVNNAMESKSNPSPIMDDIAAEMMLDTRRAKRTQLDREPQSLPQTIVHDARPNQSANSVTNFVPLDWSVKSNAKAEPMSELSQAPAVTERATFAVQTTTGAPTTAGAETARHVAGQIATAIVNQPGRPTEISLNPEELGRVRLSMSAVDASITLTIQSERPETSDLMRRHIDVLEQEFRNLGYDNISFSFGESDRDTANSQDDANDGATAIVSEAEEIEPDAPANLPQTGLDLRL